MSSTYELVASLATFAAAVSIAIFTTGRIRGTRLWFPFVMWLTGVAIFAGAEASAEFFAIRGELDLHGQFVRASYMGIGLAIPSLFHLAVVFPRNVARGFLGRTVPGLYTVGLVFAVLAPTRILIESSGPAVGTQDLVVGPGYWPLQGVLIASVIAALAWQGYLALRGRPEERKPALALAAVIAIPLALGGIAALSGHGALGPFDTLTVSFALTVVILGLLIFTGRFSPSTRTAFQALVDSIDEAVVIVGGGGRPTSMNARARGVLGVKGEGGEWEALQPLFEGAGLPREKAEFLQRTAIAVLRGRMDAFAGVIEGVGPGHRTCTVRILPFGRRDVKEEAEAALIMLRDETDRIGLEGATARSRDVLDLVIRMLGHDLKAPLTVVQGYIDLSRARVSDAPSREQTQAVRADLDKMAQAIVGMQLMMGNARALSRLAAVGDGGPGLVEIDLTRLVRQGAELLRPTADAKQVKIETALLEGVWVKAAPGFDSVPRNLVDNAVKYTPPGGTVTASLAAVDGRAVLTVADTGEGIPPERAALLFRAFERLGAEKGAQEGHGLGLAIVAKIVEISGGKVRVEDRADGKAGAVFRVEVPLGKPPA